MTLNDAKLNTMCVVKEIKTEDDRLKIRLMELGLIPGCKIYVVKKSAKKRTLLVVFEASCFTIKDEMAKGVIVNYA